MAELQSRFSFSFSSYTSPASVGFYEIIPLSRSAMRMACMRNLQKHHFIFNGGKLLRTFTQVLSLCTLLFPFPTLLLYK